MESAATYWDAAYVTACMHVAVCEDNSGTLNSTDKWIIIWYDRIKGHWGSMSKNGDQYSTCCATSLFRMLHTALDLPVHLMH